MAPTEGQQRSHKHLMDSLDKFRTLRNPVMDPLDNNSIILMKINVIILNI